LGKLPDRINGFWRMGTIVDLFISELDIMLFTWANILGLLGVICVLAGYLLLQLDRIRAESLFFSLLNLFGSSLILVSLYYYWNLASGVIESAWWVISFYGVVKALNRKKAPAKKKAIVSKKKEVTKKH
jgi:hypothetical protein